MRKDNSGIQGFWNLGIKLYSSLLIVRQDPVQSFLLTPKE
jgi:hypothetical protein